MPADETRISILGSTGSIGCSTLEVIRHLSARRGFKLAALTANDNVELLARQAREFRPEVAVIADPRHLERLRSLLAGTGTEAQAGASALQEAAARPCDWVMAAIVGIAGLKPTLAAARTGATVALANKECLVCAGEYFLAEAARAGATILPVDSEHSAIFQVLETHNIDALERIVLTASGGPFRDWPLERMAAATAADAARHPKWTMGQKISIDSASLFNKALEMIEARHLFRVTPAMIEIIIHPQSIVHSMVGYSDGSMLAQLGSPDMRTAIGYALSWPHRAELPVERLDFAKLSHLDFSAPDETRFPALRLAREAMAAGSLAGAVLNGAKEAALDSFIAGQCGFLDIAAAAEHALSVCDLKGGSDLAAVFEADASARRAAAGWLAARGKGATRPPAPGRTGSTGR